MSTTMNAADETAKLIGKTVVVFAVNYIYTGKLAAITHDVVWLEEPSIVYETGGFADKDWKNAQRLPAERFRIERSAIESMGEVVRAAASGSKKK